MYRQGSQASQEEEDQARDQDPPKSCRRSQHCDIAGCCQGSYIEDSKPCIRMRAEFGLQSTVPAIYRFRHQVLHL
jgi:hypothetical protein